MPKMPSGRLVALKTGRLNEKLRKLRFHGVKPTATMCRKLSHELLDIIDASDPPGCTQYHFSGQSLMDFLHSDEMRSSGSARHIFRKFLARDDMTDYFSECLRDIQQILTRPGIKGLRETPLKAWSPLQRYLQDRAPQKARMGSQWIAILRNVQGIRFEELEASGITEFLSQSGRVDQPVSAHEILDAGRWSEYHPVILEETTSSTDPFHLPFGSTNQSLPQHIQKQNLLPTYCKTHWFNTSHGYKIIWRKTDEGKTVYALLNPEGMLEKLNSRQQRLDDFWAFDAEVLAVQADRQAALIDEPKTATAYANHCQFGGQKYREWLVQLPDWPQDFTGNHFKLRNLIIHMRTTERPLENGETSLFLEELQSDWHQKAQKIGYARDPGSESFIPWAPWSKEWHELGIKILTYRAAYQEHRIITLASGRMLTTLFGWRHRPAFSYFYDTILGGVLDRLESAGVGRCVPARIKTKHYTHLANEIEKDCFELHDEAGSCLEGRQFQTRPEAMKFLRDHTPDTWESVRGFEINPGFARRIATDGIPLYGLWPRKEASRRHQKTEQSMQVFNKNE